MDRLELKVMLTVSPSQLVDFRGLDRLLLPLQPGHCPCDLTEVNWHALSPICGAVD